MKISQANCVFLIINVNLIINFFIIRLFYFLMEMRIYDHPAKAFKVTKAFKIYRVLPNVDDNNFN